MKKLFILLIFFSYYSNTANSQPFDLDFYKHIKEFYLLIGVNIDVTSKKDLEENIRIHELVKDINSNQISIYYVSGGGDSPFNVILIENDSIEIYDIHAINSLLHRILDLSKKYIEVSDNRKDIKWIDAILKLHLQALHQTVFNSLVIEEKRGKYTYNIMYESLKK